MIDQSMLDGLTSAYHKQLAVLLTRRMRPGPLTFGFEYEFMPLSLLTMAELEELTGWLPKIGFKKTSTGEFRAFDGLHITFEPGGQIEYGSPPLFARDQDGFKRICEHIEQTNRDIEEQFGIAYRPLAYIAGREKAPLCLKGERYRDMHTRFAASGGRGLEMMKGTASIHLHARVRGAAEILPLYRCLWEMAQSSTFAMSDERRAIWDATDPERCLGVDPRKMQDGSQLLKAIVAQTLVVPSLKRGRPYVSERKISFAGFLEHLTTIFSDVRLNLKGPTFELRTLDSMSPVSFAERWRRFVNEVEKCLGDL